MLNVHMLFYIDIKHVSPKESRIAFASNERAARENMRDDKIYRLVSARSIVHSLALVCSEIGGCQGKGLHNAHRDPRERGRERRERSTGTKLTPLLLFFLHAPYSQLEITQAPSTRRRVVSLP